MICKLNYTELHKIITDDCLAHCCAEELEGACIHFVWTMFNAIGLKITGKTL